MAQRIFSLLIYCMHNHMVVQQLRQLSVSLRVFSVCFLWFLLSTPHFYITCFSLGWFFSLHTVLNRQVSEPLQLWLGESRHWRCECIELVCSFYLMLMCIINILVTKYFCNPEKTEIIRAKRITLFSLFTMLPDPINQVKCGSPVIRF